MNNPTDSTIKATLRINPGFDPLAKKNIADETLDILPGQSVRRKY